MRFNPNYCINHFDLNHMVNNKAGTENMISWMRGVGETSVNIS